ncbi:unnamed protein product [Adineta steineri]|uniref:NHL repeat-containing protein n=1 Tax=Adineta steineri TaxID=433720 RepID=A0A819L7T5_9BILA|nr:unnamed protein product [Adineta steineri]
MSTNFFKKKHKLTISFPSQFFSKILYNFLVLALSLNQPNFSSTPIWDSNGITIANESIIGRVSYAIFVSTNNTIYVANRQNSRILMWQEDSVNPTKIITGNCTKPFSLFVTSNGDIYIDDGEENRRVQKRIAETNISVTVMNVNSSCHGLFVDINDTLYCSMHDHSQVLKRSLSDPGMTSNRIAAGTGRSGTGLNQLFGPYGIFVDANLDLYVADCYNHRVPLFKPGESNGIIVAGSKSLNPTITLNCPSGIILDAEKYLFIADTRNHRIVGSGFNGFRCLVGCYGDGSQSNQLSSPVSLSFDRSGNIFVTDGNHRIQKFFLMKDSYALSFNQPKFCPTSTWNPNGITIANQSIVGENPSAIFVSTNNTIYVASHENNSIIMWQEESVNPTKIIHANFSWPRSLFVASNGDIYIGDGDKNGRVQKWIEETNTSVTVMYVDSSCHGLFVGINDTLYCSMFNDHQVVKRSLNNFVMNPNRVAAGTGTGGSASNQLVGPRGIFVDVNLDLYVADWGNDRVQLFQSEELTGIIVAGEKSLIPTITLSGPTGIILDVDKYLFIVDHGNDRIVGSGLNGFRCLVGCYGMGLQSNQLYSSFNFSFDHAGNMFVTDYANHRIQKFKYLKRYCLKVIESGYYTFRGSGGIDPYGSIYKNKFNSLDPSDNLLDQDFSNGSDIQFRLNVHLNSGMTYILVMTTFDSKETGKFSIVVLGNNEVLLERLSTPVNVQYTHSSQLTDDSPTYYRDCQVPQCHYETLQIHVNTTGLYVLWSENNINAYGYIYQNDFNPLKPTENLLLSHDGECNDGQFKLIIDLEINTRYILVVTTRDPKITGNFSVFFSGPNNVSLSPFSPELSSCVIGDQCNFYIKGIGLTLDDILRDELKPNTVLNNQSFSIKLSAGLTIIMFVTGLINSILSFITFQNKDSQQVGCGMYLLVSSITSLLAISMFIIKFWFVVLTHINVFTSLSVLRGGCASIEPLLKLFLYLDGWLNACVAVERAVLIFKGVKFDKKKSKSVARQTILILPFCISGTLIHELIFRRLFEYETAPDTTNTNKNNEDTIKRDVSCITHYSPSVQDYNTAVLFFHLVGPFIVNLFSAMFIIFGGAHQRSMARTNKSPKEHIQEQFSEHKQLIISPIVLLILSIPRLIISLLPGCAKTSDNLWLYLGPYFISFTPSVLIFLIFVFPSDLYMKAFKQAFNCIRKRTLP